MPACVAAGVASFVPRYNPPHHSSGSAHLPERPYHTAEVTPADRFGLTLFFALVAHALVVFGVSFVPEDPQPDPASTLDIVLVQHRTENKPEEARFLAQANQDGGADSERPDRPATPLPTPMEGPQAEVVAAAPPLPPAEPQPVEPRPPAPAPVAEVVAEPEPEPKPAPPEPAPTPVLTQTQPAKQKVLAKAAEKTREKPRKPDPEPATKPTAGKPKPDATEKPSPAPEPPPVKTVNAAALVTRSMAMASLSAEIDQKLQAYAERPRRKWITARTTESKYAAYMDAWRLKVERVGNLNYPDEARRKRLSGALLLDVALNADGSINTVTLRRSSGHKVLDDAAIRIVKLAAPYSRFPPAIAAETDILHIERTWRFLNSDRFSGG